MSEMSEREREAREALREQALVYAKCIRRGVLDRSSSREYYQAEDIAEMIEALCLKHADAREAAVLAECVACPPQWEPPGEGDDGWWLWAADGDDAELFEIRSGHDLREGWQDGDWCAPLRIPERRG